MFCACLVGATACGGNSPTASSDTPVTSAGHASPTPAGSAANSSGSMSLATNVEAGHSAPAAAGASGARAKTPANAGAGTSAAPSAGQAALAAAGSSAAESGGAIGASVAGAGGSPATVETLQTCPTAITLKPGNTTGNLQSGEHMRSYLVHVPPSYTGTTPVPLVFDFHGYSQSGQAQMSYSGFRELGDQEGFIVVYPEGVGASWNVNGCCGKRATRSSTRLRSCGKSWTR
jgi:dipeptidyl aminopeptidase/acylaminoacyl peptidase